MFTILQLQLQTYLRKSSRFKKAFLKLYITFVITLNHFFKMSDKVETEAPAYTPGPNAVDISPNQDKGVLKEIITPGSGDEFPGKGNKVSVHYTGRLTDGTKFDSSVDRDELFEFTLGQGEVIKAWDIGVATMKKGEKCVLTCHSNYAYGDKGSPPKIPAGATLVFEVELFSWKLEDLSPEEDGGIQRSIIIEGEGFATPSEGSNVEVHLVGKHDGKQFEERDVKFELSEGCEVGVVNGIETALQKFNKGEKSKIVLAPKYAFGSSGNAELGVPPNATVEYEVTLKAFEKEKESWNMSIEEKIEQSEIAKSKGTNYFKDGKFEIASKQYKKITNFLHYETGAEEEKSEKSNSILNAGYLNLAACYLKLERYDEVVQSCEKALEIDPKNAKGLFRKGQAHLALKDYEQARNCFVKVLETDSTNKAAQKNLYVCKEFIRKQLESEKKMYQNMFKKMAEQSMDAEPTSGDSNSNENGLEKTESEEKQAAETAVEV
ncbi:hypothetical protein JTE90_022019 [Oedothorax gibbosus]|uniref:peptidylprolyl isomerase n=1 Tax=Oedothorax gibbosus TaxID=931172 RepID=A0AAV6V0Y0_9ARAC|nr:hypothetical protein JTE90_022019 [Oedothorax gibbosus]